MIKVITIVPGINPDLDEACEIADKMVVDGILSEYRPCVAMDEAIEAIPVGAMARIIAVDRFTEAGFETIE